MIISLDTNIWIFGILGKDDSCEKIIENLQRFEVVVPNQIRAELERNFPMHHMKSFFFLAIEAGVQFDFEPVPQSYITDFKRNGLKKGDLIIGAFCQWHQVEIIVSDNRDFLRGLSGDHCFRVMSPRQFCEKFDLS